MNAPQFHRLTVSQRIAETADSVSISFAVPDELRPLYRYTQGQFVTLRRHFDGDGPPARGGDGRGSDGRGDDGQGDARRGEQRRSYSICAGVDDYARRGQLRVGVKRVAGGLFSNWINDALQVGDSIDVMTPDGRFFTPLNARHRKHYLAFAGGSGITPVLSLIKTTLAAEPRSRFTLIYGNRGTAAIMFLEELEDLKNRYLGRLTLYHVLADEAHEIELLHGMLDRQRCARFLAGVVPAATVDEAFICGPEPMMLAAEEALAEAGVPHGKVHIERFGTPAPANGAATPAVTGAGIGAGAGTGAATAAALAAGALVAGARVDVIIDGKKRRVTMAADGIGVLDAGLAAGLDLPYSCKGGVCSTCRAKVLEGKVRMDKNYTLEQWELDKGFVLTCQSHPVTEHVVVSYDER